MAIVRLDNVPNDKKPVYSFEEMRGIVLEIIARREPVKYSPDQYGHLRLGVEEVVSRREEFPLDATGNFPLLHPENDKTFREVFWSLFRDGIIILGRNSSNPEFPHFAVSRLGEQILEAEGEYYFHDVESYATVITNAVPDIDQVTLIYLKEAMQAFRTGCVLSSTVMLGVATEHTFLLMLDTIDNNPHLKSAFSSALKERRILRTFNSFKKVLDKYIHKLPYEIKENLDTDFAGIQSVIRTFRNESGHPSGNFIPRESSFVLLQLFPHYCKKVYRLSAYFKAVNESWH